MQYTNKELRNAQREQTAREFGIPLLPRDIIQTANDDRHRMKKLAKNRQAAKAARKQRKKQRKG